MPYKIIIALFGVNRSNLLGWCFGGLAVIGASLGAVVLAFVVAPPAPLRPELLLLTAICFRLFGIFGVLLQIYCSMLAEKLEKQRVDREAAERPVGADLFERPSGSVAAEGAEGGRDGGFATRPQSQRDRHD